MIWISHLQAKKLKHPKLDAPDHDHSSSLASSCSVQPIASSVGSMAGYPISLHLVSWIVSARFYCKPLGQVFSSV
jgi:hypothetical protein